MSRSASAPIEGADAARVSGAELEFVGARCGPLHRGGDAAGCGSADVSGGESGLPTRAVDADGALNQSTLTAYERWAPLYPPVAHNPLMRVEQHAMLEAWPDMAGKRVLDLACGSGRYSNLLLEANAAQG